MNEMNEYSVVRTANPVFVDTSCPLLRLQYVDISKDASAPNNYAELFLDNNGSTGTTRAIILLNIGASATDYTQYQFSAAATGITDPAGVDASPTHTQCTTIGAVITALNAIDGVVAHRLHCPADRSFNTDDYIDIGTPATPTGGVRLSGLWQEIVYADASEVLTFAYRIGIPENIKGKIGRGRLALHKISSIATHTAGVLKISYDPDEVDASKEEPIQSILLGSTGVQTTNLDLTTCPQVYKGPILIEITGSALTAGVTTTNAQIQYSSYEH